MEFISNAIKKNFSLDSRSLALFRVFIAVILIIDFLFTRLPYFTLFYTDKGLLPIKDILSDGSFWSGTSSLNFVSTSCGYQAILFILAIFFFFMLLVGYKTKWAVLGSWILLASFHSRNFLVVNAGDTLLCLLLFWTLYLPLNQHFSIDSALREQKKSAVFSINSCAFIFQILLIYCFAYLLKTGSVWKTGQAVYYALMLHDFRTVWGDILLQFPYVMRIVSNITYYFIENLIPFLFILFGFWWRFRMVIIVLMCVFHLSMGMFLHLGFFSWICIACWLAFLPSEFWEKLKIFLLDNKKPLKVYYDGHCSFCRKSVALIKTFLILPHVYFAEAQSDQEALSEMEKRDSWLVFSTEIGWQSRWQAGVTLLSYSPLLFYLTPLLRLKVTSVAGDWFYGTVAKNRSKLEYFLPEMSTKEPARSNLFSVLASSFFFFCLVYVLMWNIRSTNFEYYSKYMPAKWNGPGAFFHLHQYWNMFAPKPPTHSGWLILSAVTSDSGKQIDLWREGKIVSMKKPYRYDTTFPVFRFRKMMENLIYNHHKYSKNYLIYLCNKWNKEADKKRIHSIWNTGKYGKRIRSIQFIHMRYKIPPPGEVVPEPKKIVISKHSC